MSKNVQYIKDKQSQMLIIMDDMPPHTHMGYSMQRTDVEMNEP